MDVHPIIKQQFRNNIFIVSSFLLQIWTWNHLSNEVDTRIQICKYFFSDFPSNFPSFLLFLCVSNSIVINSSNETIRKKSIQDPADFHEKQNSSRWTVFTERSAVIMRSDRWNFPNRSANSPRVWLHFARRSVEGRRIIRSSVHASYCTSWGCTATVWRACAPKICNFRRWWMQRFPNEFHFSKLWFFKLSRIYLSNMNWTYIYRERSQSRKFLSMCVWSHYKRCFVSFVIDFTQFVFLMD